MVDARAEQENATKGVRCIEGEYSTMKFWNFLLSLLHLTLGSMFKRIARISMELEKRFLL